MDIISHKKRKIIICQNALHYLFGSEIVTLELSEYFMSAGWEVVVFTWFLSGQMKKEFEKKNIFVTTDENDNNLSGADCVWVHHQAIPRIVLSEAKTNKKSPLFIFFHMSASEWIYLEQPYIFELEKKLAAKSVFVSEEARDFVIRKYPSVAPKTEIMPNLAPEHYNDFRYDIDRKLEKILVVSNHLPKEVLELKELVDNSKLKIKFIGEGGKKLLITPEIISEADLVITIGKTVQYCLSEGVPVFIYDHFGGPGYLTEKNYIEAEKHNFSGRPFKKCSAEILFKKIQSGFDEAKKYQSKNIDYFRQRFGIKENLASLFKELKVEERPVLSDEFFNSAISTLALVREKVIAENLLTIEKDRVLKISQERDNYIKAYEKLKNSKTVRLAEKLKCFKVKK